MAKKDTSFRERQAKFQLLYNVLSLMSPGFSPANSSLSLVNLSSFYNSLDSANSQAEILGGSYSTQAERRRLLALAIKALSTQILNYVKSNSAWIIPYTAAKTAADKLRGVRSSPPPAPTPGTPRPRGQQGYVELADHFAAILNALGTCTGYAPPDPTLLLTALNTQLTTFKNLNTSLSLLTTQLANARETRLRLYDAPNGAAEKFRDLKFAVKGQYGQHSAAWATVKSMRW